VRWTGTNHTISKIHCRSGRLNDCFFDEFSDDFKMNYGHHMNEFADCADWNRASFTANPVDLLEPETFEPNAYRECAVRLIVILECVDWFVASHRDARLAAIQVSLALGLNSTRGRSVTDVAAELGMTKQAVSRGCAEFLRMSGLDSPFGLKSAVARRTYQKSNGGYYGPETSAASETSAVI
jgi:hypothetical protein